MAEDFDPDVEINESACPACGEATTLQRTCYECGGEGGFDAFEDDPLWYDEGDIEPCDLCFGHGWMHWCGKCGHDFLAPKRLALPVPAGVRCDSEASSTTSQQRNGGDDASSR